MSKDLGSGNSERVPFITFGTQTYSGDVAPDTWSIPLSQWQFNRCGICKEPMGTDISVDHIVPKAKGGGDELENLQAAHKGCNSRKKDRYDLFALAGMSSP